HRPSVRAKARDRPPRAVVCRERAGDPSALLRYRRLDGRADAAAPWTGARKVALAEWGGGFSDERATSRYRGGRTRTCNPRFWRAARGRVDGVGDGRKRVRPPVHRSP